MTRRRAAQGFTLLEVMMTIAIMMIALMGIVSLERASVRANIESRTTAVATTNNERWAAILRRSAASWTSRESGTSSIPYLDVTENVWTIPEGTDPYALDWYGQTTTTATEMRFCTLLRLRTIAPNSALRAEIVTFWQDAGSADAPGRATFSTLCASGTGTSAGDALFGSASASGLRHLRTSVVLRRANP